MNTVDPVYIYIAYHTSNQTRCQKPQADNILYPNNFLIYMFA